MVGGRLLGRGRSASGSTRSSFQAMKPVTITAMPSRSRSVLIWRSEAPTRRASVRAWSRRATGPRTSSHGRSPSDRVAVRSARSVTCRMNRRDAWSASGEGRALGGQPGLARGPIWRYRAWTMKAALPQDRRRAIAKRPGAERDGRRGRRDEGEPALHRGARRLMRFRRTCSRLPLFIGEVLICHAVGSRVGAGPGAGPLLLGAARLRQPISCRPVRAHHLRR